MSAETVALHPVCAEVARLAAAEFAAHERHVEQEFALKAAQALYAMRPRVDSRETRIVADSFAAAARSVLRLAGLPAEWPGTEECR